jgi:hypothetical protein
MGDKMDRDELEAMYADGRFPDRTYASKSFDLAGAPGVRARFIEKVADPESPTELELRGTEWLLRESPKGRVQIKLLVSREPGHVSHIWVQRIDRSGKNPRTVNVLSLGGQDAQRLVELIRNLDLIPVDGEDAVRVDDALVKELFASPESLTQLYERDPELFRRLITDDAAARDVVALARRRAELERFKRLLDDEEYFAAAMEDVPGKKPERVWQDFFEANHWILGTGLGGQFFTSWDEEKLEKVVAGYTVASEGKRADALMRTAGAVRWLTFGEIKTHKTPLLGSRYRSGVWPPSQELSGGVAQAQATVHRAVSDLGERLIGRAPDGSEIPDDVTFVTRPRSYLVIGHLGELIGEGGGPHPEKARSFELYRTGLRDPEVVTFDELLARAEWVVQTEEAQETGDRDDEPEDESGDWEPPF